MSKNLHQVYVANPITSNATTDLMYFMQSPYTSGTDAGMTLGKFAGQFQSQLFTTANDTGVTNAMVAAFSPAITSLSNGMILNVLAANNNTGSTTLDVGTGPINIFDIAGFNNLLGGEILGGTIATFLYNTGNFYIINSQTSPTAQTLQENFYSFANDTGVGGANVYTVNYFPAVTLYTLGLFLCFQTGHPNTGSSTININSIGAKPLVYPNGSPLSGGEILTSVPYFITYSSGLDSFIMLNPSQLAINSFANNSVLLSGSTNSYDPLQVVTSGAQGTALYSNGLGFAPTFQVSARPIDLVHQHFTYAVDSGSANVYTATYTNFVSYSDGAYLSFKAAHTNTGASTFDGGGGATAVVTNTGQALVGGEIIANGDYMLMYDNVGLSGFVLINPSTQQVLSTKTILTPASGNTVTLTSGVLRTILKPAATLATLTVNMPASPVNNQLQTVTTTHVITSLTVGSAGSDTIVAAPTTLALGQSFTMIYDLGTTSWYPG